MRLQSYLNEKYVNSIKWYDYDVDVFVNPSRIDLRDLQKTSPIGYRYIVDFDTKKIYYFHSEIIHMDILGEIPNMVPNFNQMRYMTYVNGGAFLDRIFTGHGTWDSKDVESDTWQINGDFWTNTKAHGDVMYQPLKDMLNRDMKWLNKWLNTKQIKKMAQDLITKIEDSDPLRYY